MPPDRQPIYETILRALAHGSGCGSGIASMIGTPSRRPTWACIAWLAIHGQWSLVGHSSAEGKVRIFRLPWIERLELTDEPYTIPPRFRLDRFLEKSGCDCTAAGHEAQLRFRAGMLRRGRETPRGTPVRWSIPGPAEHSTCSSRSRHLDEILIWVLGFGDQVEVLEPEPLRLALRSWAERIVRIHSRQPD